MKASFTLATGLLLLASATAYAEVYRHVDAQGNVTFTDEPMQGGETIQVKPVTTITLPKPEAVMQTDRLLKEVEREGAAYESVTLAHPEDGQAFHSGNGDVTFEVRSTPSLRRGHRYEVTLDGQPVGQSSSGSITVNNIDRGTHNVGVHIVDSDGIQVKSGQPVSFTIHRPSRLN
ncbi:DUF4124 domain-containing protein [Marinobacter halophilus]|uniref:DUF4124 domain-containing protein n=1 Tax=Marinobacter halophilus TaxID=1323740 RepID=A0A2T1KHZ1_9GAMM|nr:DUF4124 domain-containing protein [Marinobacter halophilus]PSF09202.1 DUF4124 domain-containing protein [Marinobacter halophilus]GGC83507.1 hypothetical protein GCM10011362_34890 [Marinobacter halophilus]